MNTANHFFLCHCLCLKHALMSALHWENVLCCYMSSFFCVNFEALLIQGLRPKSPHPTHPVTKSLKSFWMTHSSKTHFSILSCQTDFIALAPVQKEITWRFVAQQSFQWRSLTGNSRGLKKILLFCTSMSWKATYCYVSVLSSLRLFLKLLTVCL